MSKDNNPIRPISEAEIVGSLYLEGLTESRYESKRIARINHDDEDTEIEIFLEDGYQDGTALFRWVGKYLNYFERFDLFIRKEYKSSLNIHLKPGLVTRYITSAEIEELAEQEATPDAGSEGLGVLVKGDQEVTSEALPESTPEA